MPRVVSEKELLGVMSLSQIEAKNLEIIKEFDAKNMQKEELRRLMDKVFLNPLILQKIIKRLSYTELKTTRLVNKIWKFLSNEVIASHSHVHFTWDESRKEFVIYDSVHYKVLTLNAFNRLFVASRTNFPCSHFTFSDVTNLFESKDTQEFFLIFGLKIKSLKINGHHHELSRPRNRTPKRGLEYLLNRLVPNVEHLTLCRLDYFPWTSDNRLYLPSLKFLDFSSGQVRGGTLAKILQGAPNLQTAKGFRLDQAIDDFIEFGHVHTIKHLYCNPHWQNQENLIKLLDAGCPPLENLQFFVVQRNPQLSNMYNQILDKSKESLIELDLGSVHGLVRIKIPTLNKLKNLSLGCFTGQQCLPEGINLSVTFPNLKVLDCTRIISSSDITWPQYFPGQTPFIGNLPLVETLKVASCSELWMERLQNLCPNFKKIVACILKREILPKICKLWTHLESLELMAGYGVNTMRQKSLDPLFTGLSEQVCDSLRPLKLNQRLDYINGLELTPVTPAIRDLKSLKNLTIKLSLCSDDLVDLPITRLSALYGFQLVPGLKVNIQINRTSDTVTGHGILLKELGQYVSVTCVNN